MRDFGYHNRIANSSLGEVPRPQPPTTKTIPFDYVFQFDLTGTRGNKVQDVVEISMEGAFVALSMGYSLALDETRTARSFQPVFDRATTQQTPVLVPFFTPADQVNGNTNLIGLHVVGVPGAEIEVLRLNGPEAASPPHLPVVEAGARIGSNGTATIEFKASIPAGPILRVWDRTNDLLSQLFETGLTTTPVIGPNPVTGKLPVPGDTIVHVYGAPSEFVTTRGNFASVTVVKNATGNPAVEREGRLAQDTQSFPSKGTGRVEIELTVDEATRVPLSPGDLLFVGAVVRGDTPPLNLGVPVSSFIVPRPRSFSSINLRELESGLERNGADLTGGFRLNANSAALLNFDTPLDQVSPGTFETGAISVEDVSFLYSIDVGATGREYQNKPIHNVAGLGIANGDRPFRPFAKPVLLEPRTFIRIQVEEISGPAGKLFIVLQGYKTLGTGRMR